MNIVQDAYDLVADEYAKQFFHELDGKPLDRKLLDLFSERVLRPGTVCEVGCGPGEITAYLAPKGLDILGIDVSPNMIDVARRLSPAIRFEVGDMLSMAAPENSFSGIVGFYAIVNLTKADIEKAFSEFYRTLRTSAPLLLSHHVGDETIRVSEFLGKAVTLDFFFYPVDTVCATLKVAGFSIEEVLVRSPYEGVEYPSQRAYIFAKK